MKHTPPRLILKLLKIAGITAGSLILLLFLLPYLFPGFVATKIRQWSKSSIKSELNFSAARLSFFRHFPSLTLTLYDFKLKGSAPFEKETLVESDEVSLGVDISSVFSELKIDKIFLTNAFINIQVDTAGQANYNIYNSKRATIPANAADTGSASLKIKKIIIENSKLVYNDRSLPLLINARDFNYRGSGDLSEAVFDLNSHMEVGSLDLYYDKQAYFLSKKVNADLVTRINTSSLALFFEKNDLMINQLPVAFTGKFEFLKEGYNMDFRLKSTDSDLHDIFSAMPPDMLSWLSHTQVKGFGDIDAALTGQYIASRGVKPDLTLNMKIRNGFISSEKTASPVTSLFLNFESRIPSLNPDSLSATIDSVYFNIDKDYFSAVLQLKGLRQPWIAARVNSEMDLEKWDRAFGITLFDLKGRYDLHLNAEGKYATRVIRTSTLRKVITDTVVTSIPHFTLRSSLANGYFKYASSPAAVQDISFTLNASCADSNYRHTKMDLENINAKVLSNYIRGFFRLDNANDFAMEGDLHTVFHLADLKKVIPLDSIDLAGDLKVNIKTSGKYAPAHKLFPKTEADLQLDNGRLQTKYYPHPLENIQVSAMITNTGATLKDLRVSLTPVSFRLENQPFTVTADLHDFGNLKYKITSRGTLDLGKIYRVFAVKNYEVKGLVETDLSLRGSQSDAVAGRYDQLFSAGTLKVKDLELSSELFPLPFHIKSGLFRFKQDKMWFDEFNMRYGKTACTLNGWLSNVIGYMTDRHTPLKGSFSLNSDYILADEFTAFAAGGSPSPGQSGVVMVPDDLDLNFNAKVKKVRYNGIDIDNFSGGVTVDSGSLLLDTTRFTMIGTPVEMNAVYKSLSPQLARFDYHISAKDFDVQRAYREVKLFRDMATSASKAQGIISLDYKLGGKLDGNMHPVYPSLKGGGVLSVSKVKVKGLKLFGAVSKETNKNVTDPDLSKVEIKSTINNNIITIARTRMKVSAFKLRMEGQASFDGRLNLQFRVGLPPFGVIGIPVKITGTQENPKVKAGHSGKSDQLEETEDKDEEGKQD